MVAWCFPGCYNAARGTDDELQPGSAMNKSQERQILFVLLALCAALPARAQSRVIDAQSSKLTVRVFKSGIFSAFAHDHEIAAPIAAGRVNETAPSVELLIESRALRVLDPKLSEDKRAEVQRTMQGPEVLDVSKHPEIRFRSTSIEQAGAERWTVHGTLELHGQSHPLQFAVVRSGGLYRGAATLRQTQFGITPVKVAGGTVRVKDEIRIEFEIKLGS